MGYNVSTTTQRDCSKTVVTVYLWYLAMFTLNAGLRRGGQRAVHGNMLSVNLHLEHYSEGLTKLYSGRHT